ncbi:SCL-interrupting locus protein homolog isoform X2 [Xyrichtys novacula]|uniref:SCL-interrupting locus protein homolog isoform X2 n=1 Tax=Xyrichtys novacula TaxID=13765 RepID=A0AAV1FEV6_XYRNO|nr:SCL-interrupting locus protein homolog isoform X2 [Xyrichtys novacula]
MSCPVNLQTLPSGVFESVFTPENIRGRAQMNSFTPLSFPKSRSALWDGSPTGETLSLQLCAHRKPRLVLMEKALRLAQRHARQSNKPRLLCFFLGSVSVDADEEGVTLTLDRFDPGRDQAGSSGRVPSALLPGDVLVPCLFSSQNETSDSVVQSEAELHQTFKALQQCVSSSRHPLDLSQLIKVRGHVVCSHQSDAAVFSLSWSSVSPSVAVVVQPVRSVPVIPTALLRSLTSINRPLPHAANRQRGFLTMDQTRKLLLLLESDPKVSTLPLVGLWLSGVTHIYNPQVWAWCLRFLFSSSLQDRVFSESSCFLLVLFGSTHRAPQFFQCRGSGSGLQLDYQLLTTSQSVTLYQQAVCAEGQTLRCDLGSEDLSRQTQVFRDALRSFNRVVPPAAGLSISDQDSGVEDEDLSPRPSPSPHPPAQQSRRVQPSVPELSLLVDGSFSNHNVWQDPNSAHRPPPPAPADRKSGPPTGNASSTSAAPPPPHLHSTPNSNLQQPCTCCASHTYNCTSIYSSSPGRHPAAPPLPHHRNSAPPCSYQKTTPPSSKPHPAPPPSSSKHHHTPPTAPPLHRQTPPPPPHVLDSAASPTPAVFPHHHHTPPPSHHHTPPPLTKPRLSSPPSSRPQTSSPSNNLPATPSSPQGAPPPSHHHTPPHFSSNSSPAHHSHTPPPPPPPSLPAPPSCPYSLPSVNLAPLPWLPPPSCVNQCCNQVGGVTPPDTYQLLLHQDRQLRLLQAQVQMLLEAQGKLQTSGPQSDAQTRRSTASIAVGTGASLFWGIPEQPPPHEEVQTSPASSPAPPLVSTAVQHAEMSMVSHVGEASDDGYKDQEVAVNSLSGLQSPVLGESASMFSPADDQQDFYQNLMTQLTSRLQESDSKEEEEEEEEEETSRRRSLPAAPDSSHSSFSSSSRRKQQGRGGDPVVSATLRQLHQLGVDVDEEDLTESERRKHRTVESSSTLAAINPAAVLSRLSVSEPTASSLFPGGSVDLSLEANAIALRYLSDSQLSRLSLGGHTPLPGPASSSCDSLLSPSNMSLATRKYMRRYGLIEEEDGEDEEEQEIDVREESTRPPLSEALNVKLLPQSQLIRDLKPKMQLLAGGGGRAHRDDKENCENRRPSLVRASSRQTEGSVGNILDLSRLRQLPKLF